MCHLPEERVNVEKQLTLRWGGGTLDYRVGPMSSQGSLFVKEESRRGRVKSDVTDVAKCLQAIVGFELEKGPQAKECCGF